MTQAAQADPSTPDLAKERGALVDIIYADPDGPWSICRFRRDDGTTFTGTGEFGNPVLYEDYILHGLFEPNIPGADFNARSFSSMPPAKLESVPGYLSSLTKLSRAVTNKVVAYFGEDVINILDRSPERLIEAGISEADVIKMGDIWREQKSDQLAQAHIDLEGIPHNKMWELQRIIGFDADLNERLREDPFLLYAHFDEFLFSTALKLARRFNVPNDSLVAIKGAVVGVLRRETWAGHSFVEANPLIQGVMELLHLTREQVRPYIANAVKELAVSGVISVSDSKCQLRQIHKAEKGLVDLLIEWTGYDMEDCDDYVPSQKMGIKLLDPLITGAAAKTLSAGLKSMLDTRISMIQCETIDDQFVIARGVHLWLTAFGADVTFATYTTELAAELGLQLQDHDCVATYGQLVGLDPVSGVPAFHDKNPFDTDVLVVVGADSFGTEEMYRTLLAMPKTGRIYFLGLPRDLPAPTVGQPFETIFEHSRFPTLQASFWLPARSERRLIANKLWGGQIGNTDVPFDPTSPISWIKVESDLIPAMLPEVIKAFATATGCDPLFDIRSVVPVSKVPGIDSDICQWLAKPIAEAFTGNSSTVSFNGKDLFPGLPVVVKQVFSHENHPAFSVFKADTISAEHISLRDKTDKVYELSVRKRVDMFQGAVVPPKFIRGRIYEAVILVVFKEHHKHISAELLASLINTTKTSLVVLGELDGLEAGFAERKMPRCRSRISDWIEDVDKVSS
jgi:exodeoxyribonuclease V alpha subunit